MPELPEVERAASWIRRFAAGRTIEKVETVVDTIVFSGISNEEFTKEIVGRKLLDVGRYGKLFYFKLDGNGPMPVFHLGMTGNIQFKGSKPLEYQRKAESSDTWPPRFMKFIMHFSRNNSTDTAPMLAFMDARRLGRIRLCRDPLKEHPISELGFDPILCMPGLEEYKTLFERRSCPVKALLLDQSFNAGVGNWVADEILYQARIHPEQRTNTLTDAQVAEMYAKTIYVCQSAVDVDADSSKFPDSWLFRHRWGKGKKTKSDLRLPTGELATIKWITVGGRTSAYVVELQKLLKFKSKKDQVEGSDVPEEVVEEKPARTSRRRKAKVEEDDMPEEAVEEKPPRTSRRRKAQELKDEAADDNVEPPQKRTRRSTRH